MLKIEGLSVHYGGIQALRDISMEVPEGKIVTLIGSNGAGKSTTLRSIVHQVAYTGQIEYMGENISNLSTRDIVKRGITLVPEGRRVFADMTVMENLRIGAFMRNDQAEIRKDIENVCELFPRLGERADQQAGTLSGGEQQMLAVGRALMSKPKLLMMDEPSLGLAPLIVRDIFNIIQRVNEEGITILLIEQNANIALKIADYGYVLESGSIRLEGKGSDLLRDSRVKDLYLGQSVDA